jgi:SAM-dependent methyltransferase
VRLFEKYSYWIRECRRCNHRFCELIPSVEQVQTIYDDSYFHSGGAGYADYLSEGDLLMAHGERYGRLINRYTRPGTVLDVGAAAGFVLKGLVNTGWQGEGIEPNAHMATYARQHLGINVQVGTLETMPVDGRQYDLVNMVQVVAHFHDLRCAFEKATVITRPGGYWLIETWDKDSFVARALGPDWHEYSPPSVLHWFSPATLNQFAARFGFTEVARGKPAKWLNGAHVRSLAGYKLANRWLYRPVSAGLRLVPDRLRIPYPSFDLFWALYRKMV